MPSSTQRSEDSSESHEEEQAVRSGREKPSHKEPPSRMGRYDPGLYVSFSIPAWIQGPGSH